MNENEQERQIHTLLDTQLLQLSSQNSKTSTINEEDKKDRDESIDGIHRDDKDHVCSIEQINEKYQHGYIQVSSVGSDDEKESKSNGSQKSSKSSQSKKHRANEEPQTQQEQDNGNQQIVIDDDQKKQAVLQQQEQKHNSVGIGSIVVNTSVQKPEEVKQKLFKDDPSSGDDQVQNSQAKTPMANNADENKDEDTSSQSDDEQEAEEIIANESSSSVIEVSPKGRFNRYNEELGRGAYKIVYKGLDTETGREIAWNVVNLRRLSKIDRIRIKSEIDLIKKLQHPNIIKFISAWINKQKDQVIFITEMITGGTLRKYVKKIQNVKLKVIKKWCHEILEGLIYLHEQKPHPIIHRDLKCDNVFINSHSGDIRIGDLGLSTPMQNSYSTSVLGTPEFMAPELYEECYDTGVDIYAFGMCVLEMVTLERPYKECQNPAQIYSKVIQGIRPQALERIEDEEIKNFILLCLSKQMQRPTARQLLESKFLQDLDSEKNMQIVKVKPQMKGKPIKRDSFMKQSIIKEVPDEENTDEDDDNNEEEERKEQAMNEKYNKSNIKESSDSDSDSPKEQQTEECQQTKVTQDQQIKEVVDIQQQPVIDYNQVLSNQTKQDAEVVPSDDMPEVNKDSAETAVQQEQNVKEEENDIQMEKKKKKMLKNKKRNQKLDESFTFLKQMDKEKQKKMNQQSNTLTSESVDNNILDKLRLEDENGDKKKDKKQVTQNNALMIEKKKNFKEDNATSNSTNLNPKKAQPTPPTGNQPLAKSQTLTQIKPQILATDKDLIAKQGTTAQQNMESSDLKRQSSKDLITYTPKAQQHQELTLKKSSNATSQKQQIVQSLKVTTQPSGGSQQFDISQKKPQTDNSNPIKSLQNSQQDSDEFHDSDVDKINIDPQVMIKSTLHPQEQLPQNDNIEHPRSQQQPGSQTSKSSQVQLIHQQPSAKDHNFGQIAQQKLQTNPTHSQPQINQVSSPIINQNQSQKQQRPLEEPQDQYNSRSKPQQQLKAQQIPHHNPSKTNEKEHIQTVKNASNLQHSKTNLSYQDNFDDSHSKGVNLGTIPMKFKLQSTDGTEQEVTFEFDTNGDTPQGVAQEMVQELMLPPAYSNKIAQFINDEVQNKKQLLIKQQKEKQQQQMNSLLQQQQQLLQQQLQQTTKKNSPAKISKDTAFNSLKVFQEAIECFYLGLQNKGIELSEFVEALEISEEEKALKLEFLVNVQNSKISYRNKMDEFKKRGIPNLKKTNSISMGFDTPQTTGGVATTQNGQVTQPAKQLVQQPQQVYPGSQQHQNKPQAQTTQAAAGLQTKKNGGNGTSSHQGFGVDVASKQYSSFRMRREGSHNDIQAQTKSHAMIDSDAAHFHDPHFQQQSRVDQQFNKQQVGTHQSQKNVIESHIQSNFNILLPVPQQFHTNLYKGNQNQNEEEVKILQNTLNVIYHVSITKNKSEEELQNFSHQYLKVDGVYGDKTKNFVMKFQESASLQIDGIVSDQLWKKLVYSYEKIQKEDQAKRDKINQQTKQNSQQQQKNKNQQQTQNQFYHQQLQQQIKLSPTKQNIPQSRISKENEQYESGNTGTDDNGTNNDDDDEEHDDSQNMEMVVESQNNPKFIVRENGNLYQNYAYQTQQQHQQQMYEYDQDQSHGNGGASSSQLNKYKPQRGVIIEDGGGQYDGFSQQLASSQQLQYNQQQQPNKQLSPQQQQQYESHLNKNGGGQFKFQNNNDLSQQQNYYQTPQNQAH